MKRLVLSLLAAAPAAAWAQAPAAFAPGPAPAPAPAASAPAAGGNVGDKSLLGNEAPMFDGGSNVLSWDGKHWNVDNQRLFRSRLEKYLNAPAQTDSDSKDYQGLLDQIREQLNPNGFKPSNLDDAWSLLHKASNYAIDAKLCDALADAVYSTWLAQNEGDRLNMAGSALAKQRTELEWDAKEAAGDFRIDGFDKPGPKADGAVQSAWLEAQKQKRELTLLPYTQRLLEINTRIKANEVKQEASTLIAKTEFQTLLVQFFLQRRFQHVVIGTRFYRYLFGDGDSALHLSKDTEKMFLQTSGMPPTLGILDSLSDEAMRDVKEGVDAYLFLLDKKELASATERLGETFVMGEYMPDVRTLSRDKKRQALLFTQKENQLLSAIDVKDYALAGKLVSELQAMATDFDASKPLAAIETARTVSAMHLAKAKIAAVSGDRATLEAELKAAMEIWPRNPDLAQVSSTIFNQADVQQQALTDLDRLISQHNYRLIFDDRIRFIAATALYPERQEALRKILDQMQQVEGAIIRSTEIEKRGDYAGAWEGVEQAVAQYPDDPKLNQLRAQLTTEAADFVRDIRTAEQLEKRNELGSSLAWYLKSQQAYPASEFAQQGIARLVKRIVPDAG